MASCASSTAFRRPATTIAQTILSTCSWSISRKLVAAACPRST
jgi:hypothetical protein